MRCAPSTLHWCSMLLRRELVRRLFLLFLAVIVLVGIASLLLDISAGTEILFTLLSALRADTESRHRRSPHEFPRKPLI
jgi:hypothetical protein